MLLDRAYEFLFSDRRRRFFERIILGVAIAGFLVHLTLIYAVDLGMVRFEAVSPLLQSPVAAAYTPFSFILIYEVYLLVFYLPRSITTYLRKQYEIITLIVIRRLFKDLANLEISEDWFEIKGDLVFTYDLIGSLLLFFLVFLFQQQGRKREEFARDGVAAQEGLRRFIRLKKGMAVLLVPILFAVACHTLFTWSVGTFFPEHAMEASFKDINHVFFDEFFGILIIVDVFLLLFSFFVTDDFHKLFRNSGFIVSTILLRLSFSVGGLVSIVLVVSSIVFGLLVLTIFNRFQKAARNDLSDAGS